MVVGLDGVDMRVEMPLGNVNVEVAEVGALVGETTWSRRGQVTVMLVVKPNEEIFWVEWHHL